MLKSSALYLAYLILIYVLAIGMAMAHYAPEEDDDDSSPDSAPAAGRHPWGGWNPDWDRRWRRNWDNSWAPWDNDVVRRPYAAPATRYLENDQVNNYANNGGSSQWMSIQDPGRAIPNFHEVHHYLFRGGQPTEQGLETLYGMGVRTIVNLRSDPQQTESERQLCEHHDLKYINIPLSKTAAPSNQDICRFMDAVGRARETPDGGAVFVHDHLGCDRTGAMVAIYRQLADKYPLERAYNEMLQHGFHNNYVALRKAVQKVNQNAAATGSGKAGSPPGVVPRRSTARAVPTKKTRAQ